MIHKIRGSQSLIEMALMSDILSMDNQLWRSTVVGVSFGLSFQVSNYINVPIIAKLFNTHAD